MKVLIVGLGSIARKHILALRSVATELDIYALRREANATIEEGVTNVYSLNEVKDADFVIVSNPTSLHASTIKSLCESRIPLFIEKPLFNSLGHEELVKLISENGIKTYIACNLRFLECLEYVKNGISSKRINEVNVYCGSYLPNWRPGIDFRNVYSANKNLGGGVHIDLIHELDYVYWLFKRPTGVRKYFRNVSSLEISAYDYANYLLLYNEFSVNVQLNYFRRDPKRELEIVCEDGTFHVDLLTNKIKWNGEVVFSSKKRIQDTYQSQMEFFVKNILHGNSRFNDINEAYEILTICLEN